jgi:UDP-3-O-[3-hydroxymyristoyl] glucosamine N-acyltransferase
VSIRERVRLGCRVIVQNGAVIGSDGFGFARADDGVSHEKIAQVGTVVVGDDVEIGANTTIDRPALGETRIEIGSKLDNLVQIAHGVTIGRHVLLAAQVGIAGSTTIEDRVVLAGQVGVAGHITIGEGASATAQTGIPNSVKAGTMVSGYPAIENRDWLRSAAIYRRLPELRRAFGELERSVEARFALLDRILATLRSAGLDPNPPAGPREGESADGREHAGIGARGSTRSRVRSAGSDGRIVSR